MKNFLNNRHLPHITHNTCNCTLLRNSSNDIDLISNFRALYFYIFEPWVVYGFKVDRWHVQNKLTFYCSTPSIILFIFDFKASTPTDFIQVILFFIVPKLFFQCFSILQIFPILLTFIFTL